MLECHKTNLVHLSSQRAFQRYQKREQRTHGPRRSYSNKQTKQTKQIAYVKGMDGCMHAWLDGFQQILLKKTDDNILLVIQALQTNIPAPLPVYGESNSRLQNCYCGWSLDVTYRLSISRQLWHGRMGHALDQSSTATTYVMQILDLLFML